MKLAVISDIHGNLIALESVLNAIDSENPDKIWVLGDLALYGSRPAECVAIIRERHKLDNDYFRVIGGNADRILVTSARTALPAAKDETAYQQRVEQINLQNIMLDWTAHQLGWENYKFLSTISGKEISENVKGYGLVLGYHAIPGNDEYIITNDTPDAEVVDSVRDRSLRLGIYGHIHRQVNRDLGQFRLVNPGSVGLSFDMPSKAQYAILTFNNGVVTIDLRQITMDVDAIVADVQLSGHPKPDWIEKVLRTGW